MWTSLSPPGVTVHHPGRVMRRHHRQTTVAPPCMPSYRTIRPRFTRHGPKGHEDEEQTSVLEIEPGELTRVFAAPPWLRERGRRGREGGGHDPAPGRAC